MFRLSADLTAPVHVGKLQEALDALMPRFPFFTVHLKSGVFWYSLESSSHPVRLEKDSIYPCMRYPLNRRGVFPFRIRVWKNRVAVEFSHILSDGSGAMIFLKALLAEYLHREGVERKDCGSILLPGESIVPDEDEDAFRRYGNPSLPAPPRLEKALRLPLNLERPGFYKITTGIMNATVLHNRARDYGASVGEFLVAVMLDAFRIMLVDMPESLRKKVIAPIRINVPVNLRRYWPSPTLRNFFVSIEPEIDPRLGTWTFEEIVERTRILMQTMADRKFMAQRMARNVRSELNHAARILPLKNLILPTIYTRFAENLYTSGLSNLGLMDMPAHLVPYIKRFDFIPPPAIGEKVKAALVGWQDAVHLNFGRLVRSPITELYVFRRLVTLGIPVKIETN